MPAVTGRGYADRDEPQSHAVRLAEIERRMDKVIQYGTVEEIDYEKHKARIRIGKKKAESSEGGSGSGGSASAASSGSGGGSDDNDTGDETGKGYLTDWRPFHAGPFADKNAVSWHPPQIGAQVTYVSPGGDPAQGFIITGKYQKDHSPWSKDGNVHGTQFKDKAQQSYNVKTGEYLHTAKKKSTFQVGKVVTTHTADGTVKTTIGGDEMRDKTGDGTLNAEADDDSGSQNARTAKQKNDGKRTVWTLSPGKITANINDKATINMEETAMSFGLNSGKTVISMTDTGIKHSVDGGKSIIDMTSDGIKHTVGGVELNHTTNGVASMGGKFSHDGLNVGGSHTHRNVMPGGGTSGPPIPV